MSGHFGKKGSTDLFAKALRAADYGTRREKTRPVWSAGITFGLVAVLGALLWYSYPKDGVQQDTVVSPIVRADATPIKTVPEEPGGMDIPYRDSTVFEALKEANNKPEKKKIEQLLPETEKPLERDEIFARMEAELNAPKGPVESKVLKKTTVSHETIKPSIDPAFLAKMQKEEGVVVQENKQTEIVNPAVTPSVKEVEIAEGKTSVKPAVKPVKISLVDPTTKEKFVPDAVAEESRSVKDEIIADTIAVIAQEIAKSEPASGTVVAEPVKVTGTYFVQLGSVTDEALVEKEWKRLQASYSDSLSNLNHRVQSADLGERGIYYRIQGGPVTKEAAQSICDAITEKKPGGCLVIKP